MVEIVICLKISQNDILGDTIFNFKFHFTIHNYIKQDNSLLDSVLHYVYYIHKST